MAKLEMDIDIEQFRYSLVGDGYLLSEVEEMTEEDLLAILKTRIKHRIQTSYNHSLRLGLILKESEE